jgi:type I restriction enzyme M protein
MRILVAPRGKCGFEGLLRPTRAEPAVLDDGHIDTVIGLPANLFYSTGIPVCILVLKKCKRPDDVLFINAAERFAKGKRQNQLTGQDIEDIVTTYQHRKEQERYARRVSMKEIVANDYNLNISRYVSTAVEEAEVDFARMRSWSGSRARSPGRRPRTTSS